MIIQAVYSLFLCSFFGPVMGVLLMITLFVVLTLTRLIEAQLFFFLLLHDRQSIAILLSTFSPPFERAFMWSPVSGFSGVLQHWQ
jgi:hypothetical protein